MTSVYERSFEYTEHKLDDVRSRLGELSLCDAVVLVYGSYARREASPQSDIDYVIVSDGTETDSDLSQRVRSEVAGIVPNGPSQCGAFGKEGGDNRLPTFKGSVLTNNVLRYPNRTIY